jgi:hypothetical protein
MSQMPLPEDRSQVGLSEQAIADRDAIRERLSLREGQDAYRLAIAVALAKNLPPAPENVRRTNTYGTGSVDSRGELRAAVLALRDDHRGRPYALMERLAEAGLRDLAAHLDDGRPIRQYLASLMPRSGKEPIPAAGGR